MNTNIVFILNAILKINKTLKLKKTFRKNSNIILQNNNLYILTFDALFVLNE